MADSYYCLLAFLFSQELHQKSWEYEVTDIFFIFSHCWQIRLLWCWKKCVVRLFTYFGIVYYIFISHHTLHIIRWERSCQCVKVRKYSYVLKKLWKFLCFLAWYKPALSSGIWYYFMLFIKRLYNIKRSIRFHLETASCFRLYCRKVKKLWRVSICLFRFYISHFSCKRKWRYLRFVFIPCIFLFRLENAFKAFIFRDNDIICLWCEILYGKAVIINKLYCRRLYPSYLAKSSLLIGHDSWSIHSKKPVSTWP